MEGMQAEQGRQLVGVQLDMLADFKTASHPTPIASRVFALNELFGIESSPHL